MVTQMAAAAAASRMAVRIVLSVIAVHRTNELHTTSRDVKVSRPVSPIDEHFGLGLGVCRRTDYKHELLFFIYLGLHY